MGSKKPSGRCSKKHTPPLLPPHAPAGKRTLLPGHSAPRTLPFPTPPPWPRTPPSTSRRSYLEQGDEVKRRGGEHADEEYEDPQPFAPLPIS